MLDKTYLPASIEAKQYARWEDGGAFAAGQQSDGDPYTIVIPPPNVTGSLHMGHALNNTLQDVLVRFRRMQGRDALWQPGTDHAGIATQMVVERQLAEKGVQLDRGTALVDENMERIGRADFLDKVWAWKEESGGTILNQLKRLGSSCDWSRERFTMDEGLSRAVLKVFVELHRKGLIYKDQRLVNWDPKLHTAISDLEVVQKPVNGHLWYFRYPVEDQPDRYITVATTRPETMLGDTGVAVHPDDPRYQDLIGKNAVLPIVGRKIKIVGDEHADPEQGSGAVKITPAHDFNDFEVGRRHGLEEINLFDESATLNDNAPEAYRGLDRAAARDKVVAEIEALGLLEKIEKHAHTVPYGDRSDVVIEPWLTDQWYVDAGTLAKPAIEAVEQGRTKFVPENWSKTYFEWLRNIQPWCISRQLWWGHQIPAWYGPDGEVFVELSEEDAQAAAKAHYGKDVELTRDEDVLDTWFSSALWPFSTLGWPDETPELARYYPTDVLVTGFDIIFFWVARMMMMGLHFMDEVPFHTVYIHALVRDEKGQKMSKSKGNVMDPLELVDEYGADALRFTLTAMAAMGRDIKLSTQRVAGYRNFGTKLWNAARFCEINECRLPDEGFDPALCELTLNKWIVGGAAETAQALTEALDAYKFDQAASGVYQFVWHTFCDWYVEFAKPVLQGDDEAAKQETRAAAAWTLNTILRLLHPIMPFLTEELWEQFGDGDMLISAAWPVGDIAPVDRAAAAEMDWVVRLISEVRAVRSEVNVPGGAKIPAILRDAGADSKARLATHREQILWLARLDYVTLDGDVPEGSVQLVLDEATLALPLADFVDLDQERRRLQKEIDKLAADISGIDKKLANKNFTSKAPEEVVAEQHDRRAAAADASAKLASALERLSSAG
ncbi:MAG: valine--tRNA ligase [Alphaproteobacteria bacterium]|nr:valine--tRNA ligase [Alphaproteobacteria bacterium]